MLQRMLDAKESVHIYYKMSVYCIQCVYYGSQWSSGNMPDCGVRGPGFESHRGKLHVYRKDHYDIQP